MRKFFKNYKQVANEKVKFKHMTIHAQQVASTTPHIATPIHLISANCEPAGLPISIFLLINGCHLAPLLYIIKSIHTTPMF